MGTAIGGGRQRMREQLLSDNRKEHMKNGNPKTSHGGKRGVLNRSIGYIPPESNIKHSEALSHFMNYGS